MHRTQTQQLFCHLEFAINTPDENGWLCTVGLVCAFIKRHRVSSTLQALFSNVHKCSLITREFVLPQLLVLCQIFFLDTEYEQLATRSPSEIALRLIAFPLWRLNNSPQNFLHLHHQHPPSLYGKDLVETIIFYVAARLVVLLVSLILLILFSVFSQVMMIEIVLI